MRVSKEGKQEMLFDVSEYNVKPSDKYKGVDMGMDKPVMIKREFDNLTNEFVCGVAGKGKGYKITAGRLAGIIEDRRNPLGELVEIVGMDDMEPIDYNNHIAHGVHIKIKKDPHEEYMGVYQEENGYCVIDSKNGIIINEYIQEYGVPKHILFKSWKEELGRNKALLLTHNYPVIRVVAMSEEEAESETQALGYGI